MRGQQTDTSHRCAKDSQEISLEHQCAPSWCTSPVGTLHHVGCWSVARVQQNVIRTADEARRACLGAIIAGLALSSLFSRSSVQHLAHMRGLRAHGQMVHVACRHVTAAENRPNPDGQSSAGCGAVGARDVYKAQRGEPECCWAAGGQVTIILWLLQRKGLAMAACLLCSLLMA